MLTGSLFASICLGPNEISLKGVVTKEGQRKLGHQY